MTASFENGNPLLKILVEETSGKPPPAAGELVPITH